jgi:hypothetical protein
MAKKPGRKPAAKTNNKTETAAAGKTNRPTAAQLRNLISQLRVEQQHHIDSIAEIDETFREFGIGGGAAAGKGKGGRRKAVEAAPAAPKKGRGGRRKGAKAAKATKAPKAPKATKAPKAKGATRRTPRSGKFSVTGDEFILAFVKDKGGATTEEIRNHWKGSGRGGKAENNLTGLVKRGQLKRTKLEGKAGSTYSVP